MCHLSGHCDLDLWPSFFRIIVFAAYPILFKLGIPKNGVWCSFHYWVPVSVTSGLVSSIQIQSGAYLLLY